MESYFIQMKVNVKNWCDIDTSEDEEIKIIKPIGTDFIANNSQYHYQCLEHRNPRCLKNYFQINVPKIHNSAYLKDVNTFF